MKLYLNRIEEPFVLQVSNEDGAKIVFDGSPDIGGKNKGLRPMQGVAASLAACSSIDVLYILRKQKLVPELYEVEINAKRKEDEVPAVFESIHLKFKFKGVPIDKAERAVELSVSKYCSVSRMLEHSVEITSSVELIK